MNSNARPVSLSLGRVTGDFFRTNDSTLYGGCCCCCCCFFWLGGVIGAVVGGVKGAHSPSNVKGAYYRRLMYVFWLSALGLSIVSAFLGLIGETVMIGVLVTAPAAQLISAFFVVLVAGAFNSKFPKQRKSINRYCLKTVGGCLIGYVIGWGGVWALLAL